MYVDVQGEVKGAILGILDLNGQIERRKLAEFWKQ